MRSSEATPTTGNTRILHAVNLNTVGGVEQLFAHFLGKTEHSHPFQHFALLVGDRIHPHFRSCCERRLKAAFEAKRIGFVKIPKVPAGLRVRRIRRVLENVNPDVSLVWNRFTDAALRTALEGSGRPAIYYEEGAAWLASPKESAHHVPPACPAAIAASHAAARVLQLRWSYSGKITTLANGIRPDVIPEASPVRKLPRDRPFRLGLAARLIPLKAPGTALETLALLRKQGLNCSLHIAGDGALLPRLRKRAEELGIEKNTVFRGLVRDMASFYDEIDLLLFPSVREPFGMVASEAAVRGCPAVVSRVDGLPEVVEHGVGGYTVRPKRALSEGDGLGSPASAFPEFVYDPENDQLAPPRFLDPADVAEHVRFLAENPETYSAMSKAGAERAREAFSFDRYVERLAAALQG